MGIKLGTVDLTQFDDSTNVKITTNQTVGGVKTFSSSPIVPTPTTDMQTATKKYVDANAGGDSYPSVIWTQNVTSLGQNTPITITHNLGVTQADVLAGKYVLMMTGTGRAYTHGITIGSNQFWGTIISWSDTNPSSYYHTRWQANTVKFRQDYAGFTGQIHIIQNF